MKPEKVFKNEIAQIKNEKLKEFVVACLTIAPKYFYFMPSSMTGKHHPSNELSIGGQVIHVKKMVVAAQIWGALWGLEDLSKDKLIVASLLHDICKCGLEPDLENLKTDIEHPFLVRVLLEKHKIPSKFFNEKGADMVYEPIMRAIESHMGRWTPEDKKELIQKYYKEYSGRMEDRLIIQGLATNDYYVSNGHVDIEILRSEPCMRDF